MSRMKLLLDVIEDIRSLADSLQAVATALGQSDPEDAAAHALCEHKLRRALKMRSRKPVSKYDCDEMDGYTDGYETSQIVAAPNTEIKTSTPDAPATRPVLHAWVLFWRNIS